MTYIPRELVLVALTAILMWGMGWVRTFLARRVRIETPDAKMIAQLLVAIRAMDSMQDALMDAQMLQSKALAALLEAAKGKMNGNVDNALLLLRGSEAQFNSYLRARAKPEIPDAQ